MKVGNVASFCSLSRCGHLQTNASAQGSPGVYTVQQAPGFYPCSLSVLTAAAFASMQSFRDLLFQALQHIHWACMAWSGTEPGFFLLHLTSPTGFLISSHYRVQNKAHSCHFAHMCKYVPHKSHTTVVLYHMMYIHWPPVYIHHITVITSR